MDRQNKDIISTIGRRGLAAAAFGLAFGSAAAAGQGDPAGLTLAPDQSGVVGTYNAAGATDPANPFFVSLGRNGRSCSTCHVASEGMTFTPRHASELYRSSRG